ncbi:MAG: class I SAM-dependent methyltransferase [Bacteroidia bacterium]|nr:class I SAM-dependent methyltransferase [Bacteroidia bacterium]
MKKYDQCPICGSENISFKLEAKDYTVSGKFFRISQCRNCTLRFTNPVPEQEEIGYYYQSDEYISHSNTSKGFINKAYQIVRGITLNSKQKLVIRSSGKRQGKILDVGCGTGEFLNKMKEAGWTTQGIEPEDSARKMASENFGLTVEEPAKFFEFSEAEFDVITMWHVLEHVHQLDEYIANLKRLLKPNGTLIIAVPNYQSHDAKKYRMVWAAYDVPRHLYHFSVEAMNYLMGRFGFVISKIKMMPFDSFYVSMLSEKNSEGSMLLGIWVGFVSWVKAVFRHEKCSSLIYIIHKSEA